jgi:universal stress protein
MVLFHFIFTFSSIKGGRIMSKKYENIMVAVDGSHEAELAFEKGVNVALRNGSKLTLAHVVDTRALQSVSTFDAEVYEGFQTEANELLEDYIKRAKDAGLHNVATVIEMGNPKVLLAHDIPEQEGVDLIMVGATGLNAFERLLVGSSSEYILRHAKVDLLVVRDKDKTF